MATAEQYIAQISTITDQGLLTTKCEELKNREDALSIVPAIFSSTENPLVLLTGVKILEDHIQANWIGLSEEDKSQLRDFVIENLGKEFNKIVLSQLHKVLAKIAIRSYPEEWPDYLDNVLYSYDFDQFEDFLEELGRASASKADFLPVEKKNEIVKQISQKGPEFLDYFIRSYAVADHVLQLYIPYIKFSQVSQIDFSPLFVEDPDAFGPICSILQLEGVPDELVINAFNCAAALEVESTILPKIIPVLQKHIHLLEKENTIEALTHIHKKLFDELEFRDILYYWEGLVVQIYSEFHKSGGTSNRFQLHYEILTEIREYVILHMEQPPDFIIPEEIPSTKDEEQREIYNSMRSILVSFVGMTPKEVNEAVLNRIPVLKEEYNDEKFLSFIWTLGCISGVTTSQLESVFVIESMKFVLQIFRHPRSDKAIVATCFLFLASEYAKAGRLTPEFIEQSIRLAIQALNSPKTQRMAANTLLSISKYSSKDIATIPPPLIEIIRDSSMDFDIYSTVVESAGRLYLSKNKFDTLLTTLNKRWMNVIEHHELSFECAREELLLMNGFVGLSRVNPISMEKYVVQHKAEIDGLTQTFATTIAEILEEIGSDGLRRDDINLMMLFLQAETILFTELHYRDGCPLLALLAEMPPAIRIRIPEMLSFLEALFKANINEETAMQLHTSVILPTIEMISEDPEETREHLNLFPRVLTAFATGYSQFITQDDINFLLEVLKDTSHMAVFGAIKALDTIVEKADLRFVEEQRDEFFRNFLGQILFSLMLVIADQDHSFCYLQLLRFIYKICDLVISGKLRVNLFPEEENIPGLIMRLGQSIVETFPLIIPDEIGEILTYMFQAMPLEQFEEALSQYIAKARQTTPSEALQQIRLQEFMNDNPDFYY